MINLFAIIRGKMYIYWCTHFRKNIAIGKGLKLYNKISIGGRGKVEIGENCTVDGIIGDNSHHVCIDSYNPSTIIKIGNNVKLYAARIGAKYQISIGDDVLIEESGIIDTDFHSIHRGRGEPVDESREKCKVLIGNRVSIGARSIIIKGVTIGDDVVILPGSIVAASVKSGSIVCGNPARPIINDASQYRSSAHYVSKNN
jgi:acetyltransferase-like isoleucine patch superfamily enzyme